VYARVATFEGSSAEDLDRIAEGIRQETGPPEGVPAVEFMMFVDKQAGKSLAIAFFESEEDMRKGDEALNAMNPPTDASGSRAGVDLFEVAVRVSAGS
jgi:hypothetical protein